MTMFICTVPYDICLLLHRLADIVTRERMEEILGWERKVYPICSFSPEIDDDMMKKRQSRMLFRRWGQTIRMEYSLHRPNSRELDRDKFITWTLKYEGHYWRKEGTSWIWECNPHWNHMCYIEERMRKQECGFSSFIYWRDVIEWPANSGRIEETIAVKSSFTTHHSKLFNGTHPCF